MTKRVENVALLYSDSGKDMAEAEQE